ncbi:MAG: hypothetical protein AAGJ83_01985 [Planctomycetota bacterium]
MQELHPSEQVFEQDAPIGPQHPAPIGPTQPVNISGKIPSSSRAIRRYIDRRLRPSIHEETENTLTRTPVDVRHSMNRLPSR